MALTDAERKLLAELEATFTAQDPKLVSKFAQPAPRAHLSRAVVGVIGFLVGLVVLVVGLSSYWWISVLGFIVMLVAAVVVFSTWTKNPGVSRGPTRPAPQPEDFMSRLEKRWQDRQGQ